MVGLKYFDWIILDKVISMSETCLRGKAGKKQRRRKSNQTLLLGRARSNLSSLTHRILLIRVISPSASLFCTVYLHGLMPSPTWLHHQLDEEDDPAEKQCLN